MYVRTYILSRFCTVINAFFTFKIFIRNNELFGEPCMDMAGEPLRLFSHGTTNNYFDFTLEIYQNLPHQNLTLQLAMW